MKKLLTIFLFIYFAVTGCNKDHNGSSSSPVVAIEFLIPADSVKVNPYGYTPLSALVNFTSEKEGKTFLRVHGKHGAFSDVTHLFNDFGTSHSIPVIGMYAGEANTADVRIINNNGDTLEKSTVTITTQALPEGMPASVITSSFDEHSVNKGLILVSSFSTLGIAGKPTIPYMIDDYGDIRWVLDYSTNDELKDMFYDDGIARLRNGNFYFGNISTSKIYEVDLSGKIVNTWSMTGYIFHHNVQEKPNGNFLVSVSKSGSFNTNGVVTTEDYIIEINRQDGTINNEWDLKESLNEYRRVLTADESDWIHVNSVIYDSTDNTIIISGRVQGVIKLDYSNKVKWILAPHKDWGTNRRGEDLNKFLLTPLDASGKSITDTSVIYGTASTPDFEWNYYQHSNILLPDGNLMLFDNGTSRSLDVADGSNAFNGAPGKYSRATEYKIDPEKMTVQQVWQYGKERDVMCYSSIVSSVQHLPETNHVLFAPGAFVQNEQGKGGKIIELDYGSKKVINEISISSANNWGFHRAKKMNAYPDNL